MCGPSWCWSPPTKRAPGLEEGLLAPAKQADSGWTQHLAAGQEAKRKVLLQPENPERRTGSSSLGSWVKSAVCGGLCGLASRTRHVLSLGPTGKGRASISLLISPPGLSPHTRAHAHTHTHRLTRAFGGCIWRLHHWVTDSDIAELTPTGLVRQFSD